jgi:predicted nucleic acid-binding protein
MFVWWAASVECMSAIQRQMREGNLSAPEASVAIENLRVLEEAWIEIEPTQQVRQQAERLLRLHALRAADALQLAAAIIGTGYEPHGMVFLTSDTRLGEAAAKEGFKVA